MEEKKAQCGQEKKILLEKEIGSRDRKILELTEAQQNIQTKLTTNVAELRRSISSLEEEKRGVENKYQDIEKMYSENVSNLNSCLRTLKERKECENEKKKLEEVLELTNLQTAKTNEVLRTLQKQIDEETVQQNARIGEIRRMADANGKMVEK